MDVNTVREIEVTDSDGNHAPQRWVEKPGTIALPTSEIGRFTLFMMCLASTRQPVGTNLNISASASVTQNLNHTIKDMRDDSAWLWIIGDDHAWEPDLLMKQLAILDQHPHIDILVPLVVKRNPPWNLVVFKDAGESTEYEGLPAWKPFEFSELPPQGIFEVDAAGSAGMLVKRKVLDTMGYPWFESSDGVYLNEDVLFCQKARNLGYRIFGSVDVTMGHIGIFNVRPLCKDGKWGALAEFSTPEEKFRHIYMPITPPEMPPDE